MESSLYVVGQALKFDLNKVSKLRTEVRIAVEEAFSLYVNGELYTRVMLTPSFLEEWAVGFLYYKGMVESKKDIERIIVHGSNVAVSIKSPGNTQMRLRGYMPVPSNYVSLANVDGERMALIKKASVEISSNKISIPGSLVRDISRSLNGLSEIFRVTGGTHSAALFDIRGKCLTHIEDVGRHNAVDKVIGSCILHDIQMKDKILAVSGRLSEEVVFKCVRAYIPILISLSAPLSRGVRLARAAGITLIGFARGSKFNVYTYPNRIT